MIEYTLLALRAIVIIYGIELMVVGATGMIGVFFDESIWRGVE